MWPSNHSMSLPNLPIHNRRLPLARLNMQILGITRQDLHPPALQLLRVNKNTSTIVVALESFRNAFINRIKSLFVDLNICSPRSSFTRILEPLKRQPPTNPRKEAQLPLSLNRHLGIIDFEFTSTTTIVTPSAEAQVRTASVYVPTDPPVTFAVERAAVP
jgi:hypothetical protein